MLLFPKTKAGERTHRDRKRALEMSITVRALSEFLEARGKNQGNCRILDIGSGMGTQIPRLKNLGLYSSVLFILTK
jgi:hypothetical protein